MKQRWKSKLLALILVVIMFLGMLPGVVQAAGGTGTTGIWKWKVLEDGTLGITGCTTPSGGDLILPASLETGSGPLAVTSIEANAFKCSSPLFFPSDIKTFVMPDSVTRVGDSAFYWCNKLTSVTLSANLRTLGASAFYNCTALTSITLPDTLESIGASALANCSVLGEVRLPDNTGFTALPEKLFNGDTLLKTTNIGSLSHLTSIGSMAFLGTGVETITLPNSVTVIGSGAFNACWYLASVNLPDNPGFTAIPDSMFAECKTLQSLTIPASVTSIGADALNGCNVLSSITVAGANPAFASEGGVLYNADKTILICHPAGRSGTLTIPDSVTEIGNYAFLNSSHLTAVNIPDSVERIDVGAFFNCSNSSLTRIVLPDSVQSIGAYAFNACAGVTQMTIPEGIEVIGPYTFNGCGSLTGIALPDSLQSIGDFAFLGCDSLPAVSIPANVTSIGNGVFEFCTDLRKAVILAAGTSFGSDVFKYTAVANDGIYGFESSTAQTYAQAKGFPFHAMYRVSFSVGEGSPVSDLIVTAGAKIIKPADPTQAGSLFGGWYKDEACSDNWDFDNDRVNENTTLYAKWRVGTAPTITTTSLPGGAVGVTYSQTLAATGDTPMTWSVASGILPDGLNLTGGDTISGVPTASGTFDFTIKAENITGNATQDLSITISKTLLSITTPPAITGVANGTEKTALALGLPAAVTLVTTEGNVSGEVVWDVTSSAYDPEDTAEQTFTVGGTVSLPSGVANPNGVSLDVSIDVTVGAAVSTDKTLISIMTPTAITGVANGAEKTALGLGLPSAVTLVTDEGNVSGDVVWDVTSSTYDPADTAAQSFTVDGTVSLPSGVINPDGVSLDVTVSVTVLAAVSTEKTLISVTTPTAITGVANGTEKTTAALGLPAAVTLVTDKGNVSGNVTWNVSSSSYDPADINEQTFMVNGTITLPSGVINPDNVSLDVTINVTVLAAVSTDKTLISVTAPTAITGVANGTEKTALALGLPDAVTLVTDAGNVSGNVTWDVASSSYDPADTAAQTFTVGGTVSLPSGVVNPDGVSLDVTVSVTVLAAVSTEKTLISITPPTAITGVANGTEKTAAALGLPSTVILVTDGEEVSGGVTWNVASSTYNPSSGSEQTFTVNGTVSLPGGVINPNSVPLNVTISVTVIARSGGGGGSGGGGSTPDNPNYTADLEVTDVAGNGTKKTTLPVTVDKTASSATIDIGNLFSEGGTSVINLPSMPGISTYSFGIPVPSLSSSDGQGSLTLHTDLGSITVPADMLTGVENVDGSKAQITIGQGNPSSLPETVRTAIGNHPLITLTLSVDGEKTAWNNPDAPVTVAIPYTPTAEELANPEHIVVWYIDGAGSVVTVPNGYYDPDSGTVVFSTSHFSDYAVAYDPVIRLAGVDGVETALAIARATYSGKVSNAVLATAGNYPDALSGSVLAYKLNAPILLVGDSEAGQKKVLDYLTAKLEAGGTVYILGGTAVISQSFADKLRNVGIKQTIRLAGNDCYATSVKIAEQLQVETGTPVVLVSGENYPDALSVSSIAAQKGYPIMLVQKNGIPTVVKEKIAAIKPDKVYIIGLQGAVGKNVEREAGQLSRLAAEDLIRIGGEDRYDTSLAVAQYFFPNLSDNSGSGNPSKVQTVCIATGNNFPDALAGSVYAARYKAPIILVDANLPEQVIHYLEAGELSKAAIFGGEYIVGKDIEDQLREMVVQ